LGFAEGDAAGFPPPKDLAVGHALGEVVEGDAAMAQSSWIDRPLKRATGKPRTEFQASWHGGAAGVYGRRTRQQRIARRSRLLPLNGQTSASPPPVRLLQAWRERVNRGPATSPLGSCRLRLFSRP
jgi:hypothetical protein